MEDATCWISVRVSLPARSSRGSAVVGVSADMSAPIGVSSNIRASGGRADARGLAQEGQQFTVDLPGVRDAHDVGSAVDLDVARVGQRGVQAATLSVDGED